MRAAPPATAGIAETQAAFPAADVYLAPGVRDQVRKPMDFPCLELAASDRYPWDGEVRTCAIESRFFTEVDFFHLASRTLVLTDLIENFEARKLAMRSVSTSVRDAR